MGTQEKHFTLDGAKKISCDKPCYDPTSGTWDERIVYNGKPLCVDENAPRVGQGPNLSEHQKHYNYFYSCLSTGRECTIKLPDIQIEPQAHS